MIYVWLCLSNRTIEGSLEKYKISSCNIKEFDVSSYIC